MMHDLRPSELKIGAFLGLESHFPVLGGYIPMKIPIGPRSRLGGHIPKSGRQDFGLPLVLAALWAGLSCYWDFLQNRHGGIHHRAASI